MMQKSFRSGFLFFGILRIIGISCIAWIVLAESWTVRAAEETMADGKSFHRPSGPQKRATNGYLPEKAGEQDLLLSHSASATIVATVLSPFGGGNHDPETIRDGVRPPVGSADSSLQYDTFTNHEDPHEEFIGYRFDGPRRFTRVVFQEGKNFIDGGWVANGSLRLQVRTGGAWSDVPADRFSLTPDYPDANYQTPFGESFETYTFTLAGVTGDGLRLTGIAGGSKGFVSLGELEVWGEEWEDPPSALLSHDPNRATIVATVLAPQGGGNHDPETIRDGVKPPVGTSHSALQYDTFTNHGLPHEEFVGYVLPVAHRFRRMVFQEGRHFVDGGWFADGSLRLEVLSEGSWGEVPPELVTLETPYPTGDQQAAFGASFETYTFLLSEVVGEGLRLVGAVGGEKRFLSVGELEVWGLPAAPELVLDSSILEVPEGSTASFRVRLSMAPVDTVTVSITHGTGDQDLAILSGAELVFTPESWDTEQVVHVAAAEDADAEGGTATFVCAAAGLPERQVEAREIDDESRLRFALAAYTVEERDGAAGITVLREGSSVGAVSVGVSTVDETATAGFDYAATTETLSWSDGELGARSFSVQLFDDEEEEPAETLRLALSGATGGALLGDPSAVLTIAASDSATAAHWPLDDGNGDLALDVSGGLHHGALVDGPSWRADGPRGGSLSFDGVDDRVVIVDPGPGFVDDSLSLALWVRPDRLDGIRSFVSKDGSFELEIGRTGLVGQFALRLGGQLVGGSESRLRAGIWQHVAVTWSRATGEVRYYYNGELDGVFPHSGDLPETATDLGLGGRPSSAYALHGSLDEVRIFDRLVGSSEMASLATGATDQLPPRAEIAVAPIRGFAPLEVAFDAGSSSDSDGSLERYVWDFGDGSGAERVVVSHSFVTDGLFSVSLRVEDDEGASGLASVPIEVWAPGEVEVRIEGGEGSGFYAAGSRTTVVAENPPAGRRFAGWVGSTVGLADPGSPLSPLTVQVGTTQITATDAIDQRPAGWRGFRGRYRNLAGEIVWGHHANWSDGALPRAGDSVEVGDDESGPQDAVVRSLGQRIEALEIAESPGASGSRLTIRGGELTVGAQSSGRVTVGKDSLGELVVETGRFHAVGPVSVSGPWSDARGIVRLLGGELIAEGEIRIGLDTASPSAGFGSRLEVEGGELISGGPITVSSSDPLRPGVLRIAGDGVLRNSAGGVVVLAGILAVEGPAAVVEVERLELGTAGARLRWSGPGVAPVRAGEVWLAAGSWLEVEGLDLAPGSYLLVDGSSIVDEGLAFAPGTDLGAWSFEVDSPAGDLILHRSGVGSGS